MTFILLWEYLLDIFGPYRAVQIHGKSINVVGHEGSDGKWTYDPSVLVPRGWMMADDKSAVITVQIVSHRSSGDSRGK